MDPKTRLEIVDKLFTLMTAAFGLVAALAWNDAIQALFKVLFGEQSGLVAKFVYAAAVTVFIVLVTMKVSGVSDRLKKSLADVSK